MPQPLEIWQRQRAMADTLYFLMGPTAVGKTDLSLEWAERLNAEIISTDSLLFYRGMDIGTAKPSRAELQRVPHHLIDVVDVDEPLNLLRYLELVKEAIQLIVSRGKNVLLVGGSGFYVHSFFQPFPQDIADNDQVREDIQILYEQLGVEGLLQALDERHPDGTPGLDRNNPHRVMNALLRSRLIGKSWSEMREEWESRPQPFAEYTKKAVRLGRPNAEMFPRIEKRITQMMDQGLLEEVERLKIMGIEKNPTARTAIGYREILENPNASRNEIEELIALHTRQLVRKQEKWFRSKFARLPVIHPDHAIEENDPGALFQTP